MSFIPQELKLRFVSGIAMFSSVVFIISLGGSFYFTALILIALFCAAEFFMIINKKRIDEAEEKKWIFKGVALIGVPIISLYIIREVFSNGIITAFWFFLLVSMVDTFAYFIGKFIGRTKLAPSISPSKTVEGLIGGVLLATLFSLIFFYIFKSKLHIAGFLLISLTISLLAQVSDLLESKFKRMFDVKDSSNLIPGHGGFLDRLDGYLLTAPTLVIFYFLFKTLFSISIF